VGGKTPYWEKPREGGGLTGRDPAAAAGETWIAGLADDRRKGRVSIGAGHCGSKTRLNLARRKRCEENSQQRRREKEREGP